MIIVYSCKKDNVVPAPPTTPAPPTEANGFPLSVGSYWIYENFITDTNNVDSVNAANPTDSCYIVDDTIFGGKAYSVFVGNIVNENAIFFRRDSAGFIVDQYGTIHYSKTDFINTLRTYSIPGTLDAYFKMAGPLTTISVPAGAFPSFDYQGMFVMPASYPHDNPRYSHAYYGNNVGLVKETTFFYSSPDYISRRLLRYHIQ
jgi:hypothetical protein